MKTIILTEEQVEFLRDLLNDHFEACVAGEQEDRASGNEEDADTAKEQGELALTLLENLK